MQAVQTVIGFLLILLGAGFVLMSALAWLGVVKPNPHMTLRETNQWDVLQTVAKKLPWMAIVGLLLIYAGLKMIGVALSF